MILAIETATPVCSVAFMAEDGTIYEKRESGRGIHSEKLFLFIEELMHEHFFKPGDLDEVLLSSGPGSYTGLRIGAAAIKGLLFRQEPPLLLLGSLELLAAGALHHHPEANRIHAVIDARRQHLYYQMFVLNSEEIAGKDPATTAVTDVNRVIEPGDIIIGTGLERLEAFQQTAEKGTLNYSDAPFDAGSEKRGEEGGGDTITFLGESAVSAVNLIHARKHSRFNGWFRQVQPGLFEPEYLSLG